MAHGLLAGLFSRRGAQFSQETSMPPALIDTSVSDDLADEIPADRSFEFALDALPCNAMFCDRNLILRYLNRSSRKTLLSLQEHLPLPVDQLIGKSIHVFHRSPENVERILGTKQNPHHLPHKATIALGPIKLDQEIEPMVNGHGEYIGAVVLWGISTQQTIEALKKAQEVQRNDIEHLNGNLQMVATATHEIRPASQNLPRTRQNWQLPLKIRAQRATKAEGLSSVFRHRAAVSPRLRSSLHPLPRRPACWP